MKETYSTGPVPEWTVSGFVELSSLKVLCESYLAIGDRCHALMILLPRDCAHRYPIASPGLSLPQVCRCLQYIIFL